MLQDQRRASFFHRYGPWAVVTGASSGIGRAIAICLAEAQFNLVLVARSRERLEALSADLRTGHGVEIQVLDVDLSLADSRDHLEDITRSLDVGLLVAAAGFGTSGDFLQSDLAQELEMVSVNCSALMAASLLFGQRFAQRGRGGLILMSSIVGFQGTPYSAHYAATKAYVQSLAEALWVELAPLGIDVLAAAPGPTESGFAARAGMKMGATLTPEAIALPILQSLGCRSTVLPGGLSKVLSYPLNLLPRWARVQIMGRVMRGMTR